MDNQGLDNLVNAIYSQAVEDYTVAVICNTKKTQQEIEDFLVSGAYGRNPKIGEYIKKKCLEEINICIKFINEVLLSDLEKVSVDKNLISIPILKTIVNERYKMKLKFKTESNEGKVYLCKK